MPLTRRLPKRGFNNAAFSTVYAPVNLSALRRFPDGAEVTPEDLRRAGLANGKQVKIKILGGGGALDRKLSVKAHAFSAAARQRIESAGGRCEVVR